MALRGPPLCGHAFLPFGPEEARLQQVEREGQPIGMADYMIAAVCIAVGGILLTRNRKRLERIEGSKLGGHIADR